jgi:hypothetical protein
MTNSSDNDDKQQGKGSGSSSRASTGSSSLKKPSSSKSSNNSNSQSNNSQHGSGMYTVYGKSPLEAWGKVLTQLGLIDEVIAEHAFDALMDVRKSSLKQAKERLKNLQLQRKHAKIRHKQRQQGMDVPMGQEVIVEAEANDADGEGADGAEAVDAGEEIANNAAEAGALVKSGNNNNHKSKPDDVSSCSATANANLNLGEDELQSKFDILIQKYHQMKQEADVTKATLCSARLNAMGGPFLQNPFSDVSQKQQDNWLTAVIRKEKAKMGSTGNKRKILNSADLLNRMDTFFNNDIEGLVEGLPGSELCPHYVFKACRGAGTSSVATTQAWVQEAHIKAEQERDRQRKVAKEIKLRQREEHEREERRKLKEVLLEQRKQQKADEDLCKRKARTEERLQKLTTQVEERLFKEALMQREKVVTVAQRSIVREWVRRRGVADKVAAYVVEQGLVDGDNEDKGATTLVVADASSHADASSTEGSPNENDTAAWPAQSESLLLAQSQSYDKNVLRIWDFLHSFQKALMKFDDPVSSAQDKDSKDKDSKDNLKLEDGANGATGTKPAAAANANANSGIPDLDAIQEAVNVLRQRESSSIGSETKATTASLSLNQLEMEQQQQQQKERDAVRLLTRIGMTLCRPLAGNLTKLLSASVNSSAAAAAAAAGSGTGPVALNPMDPNIVKVKGGGGGGGDHSDDPDSDSESDTESSSTKQLVELPVTEVTWTNVARLAIMADALMEGLLFTKMDCANVLRGYRSGGHPNSREAQRLRKQEETSFGKLRQALVDQSFQMVPGLLEEQVTLATRDKPLKVTMAVSCLPSTTCTDHWTFYLHNCKALPPSSAGAGAALKENIQKAVDMLLLQQQSQQHSHSQSQSSQEIAPSEKKYITELRHIRKLIETGGGTHSDTERNSKATKAVMKVLEKVTGERYLKHSNAPPMYKDMTKSTSTTTAVVDAAAAGDKSSSTSTALVVRRQLKLQGPPRQRMRVGCIAKLYVSRREYKDMMTSREDYMAAALKQQLKRELAKLRKEKVEKGEAHGDEEEEEEEEEDDDEDEASDDDEEEDVVVSKRKKSETEEKDSKPAAIAVVDDEDSKPAALAVAGDEDEDAKPAALAVAGDEDSKPAGVTVAADDDDTSKDAAIDSAAAPKEGDAEALVTEDVGADVKTEEEASTDTTTPTVPTNSAAAAADADASKPQEKEAADSQLTSLPLSEKEKEKVKVEEVPYDPKIHKLGRETPYDEFCVDDPKYPELIRRCLAVVRSLCLTEPAQTFIYPVDPQTNPRYYETVTKPICLQNVGEYLTKQGKRLAALVQKKHKMLSQMDTEDATLSINIDIDAETASVVAQFARDVRLLAANCVSYSVTGAALISQVEQLMRIFERLLLDWVLSPFTLIAKLEDLDDDKCVDHHLSDNTATLILICDSCEGKFNMSRLEPALTSVPSGDWFCPRCVAGRCWAHIDPRIGREVNKVISTATGTTTTNETKDQAENGTVTVTITGRVKTAHAAFPERGGKNRPCLLYTIHYADTGLEETWTLEEVDEALSLSQVVVNAGSDDAADDPPVPVPPILCEEALAECPGYGSGRDMGISEVVPVALNPHVTDAAAQAMLSSSVFVNSVQSVALLGLCGGPEEMTADEWLNILYNLSMKCALSDSLQQLVVQKEINAAAKLSRKLKSAAGKSKTLLEVLPKICCDDEVVEEEDEDVDDLDDNGEDDKVAKAGGGGDDEGDDASSGAAATPTRAEGNNKRSSLLSSNNNKGSSAKKRKRKEVLFGDEDSSSDEDEEEDPDEGEAEFDDHDGEEEEQEHEDEVEEDGDAMTPPPSAKKATLFTTGGVKTDPLAVGSSTSSIANTNANDITALVPSALALTDDVHVPSQAETLRKLRSIALARKLQRQKMREDGFVALALKVQLRPMLASLEEDTLAPVIRQLLLYKQPEGLDLDSCLVKQDIVVVQDDVDKSSSASSSGPPTPAPTYKVCDLCRLSDVALGSPLMRVPNREEWTELMAHQFRHRSTRMIAQIDKHPPPSAAAALLNSYSAGMDMDAGEKEESEIKDDVVVVAKTPVIDVPGITAPLKLEKTNANTTNDAPADADDDSAGDIDILAAAAADDLDPLSSSTTPVKEERIDVVVGGNDNDNKNSIKVEKSVDLQPHQDGSDPTDADPKESKLVVISVRVGGQLISDDEKEAGDNTHSSQSLEFAGLPAHGMLELIPRNAAGAQDELRYRSDHHLNVFVTGSFSAHECCAVAAQNARRDVLLKKHKERLEASLEQNLSRSVGKTLPLGGSLTDAQGRTYWKFRGEPRSLFIVGAAGAAAGETENSEEDGKSCWRYKDPEQIASVIVGLSVPVSASTSGVTNGNGNGNGSAGSSNSSSKQRELAEELKRQFPHAARLIRNGTWSELLQRKKWAHIFDNPMLADEEDVEMENGDDKTAAKPSSAEGKEGINKKVNADGSPIKLDAAAMAAYPPGTQLIPAEEMVCIYRILIAPIMLGSFWSCREIFKSSHNVFTTFSFLLFILNIISLTKKEKIYWWSPSPDICYGMPSWWPCREMSATATE